MNRNDLKGTAPQRPKADPKEKPGRLSFVMDESSVDRWHPSNVEWPEQIDGTRNRSKGPTNPAYLLGYYHPQAGPEVVPLAAYEALFADRGRVLAAARELAEAVERGFEDQYPPVDWESRMFHAAASFREVDQ